MQLLSLLRYRYASRCASKRRKLCRLLRMRFCLVGNAWIAKLQNKQFAMRFDAVGQFCHVIAAFCD